MNNCDQAVPTSSGDAAVLNTNVSPHQKSVCTARSNVLRGPPIQEKRRLVTQKRSFLVINHD
jgi:hypothetical protein